jgi:hypothetical protein
LIAEFAAKEKLEIVLSAPVRAYRWGRQDEAGGREFWGNSVIKPTALCVSPDNEDCALSFIM